MRRRLAVSLLWSALSAISPAFAQQRPGDLEAYQRYVDALIRIMRENPGVNMQDAARRAAEESGVDLPAGPAFPANGDLVPESRLFKQERVFILSSDVRELVVGLSSDARDFAVRESARSDVAVMVQAISSNGAAETEALLRAATVQMSGGVARIQARLASYSCVRSIWNGALSARGGCYHRIVVELPTGSETLVRTGRGQRLNQFQRPLSSKEAVDEIADLPSSDRLPRLQAQTANRDFRIDVGDWARLMNAIPFHQRRSALELVAARLESIPVSVVGAMLDFLPFHERYAAFVSLAPKVPRSERRQLLAMTESAVFPLSDARRARQYLLELTDR